MRINEIYSLIKPDVVIAVFSKNHRKSRVNLSAASQNLQASFLNLSRNTHVSAHSHLKTERNTIGTQEAWVVLKGRAEVLIYDLDKTLISNVKIKKGQVIVLFDGGHALKSKSRNLTLVEIKNGPYLGKDFDAVHI